MNSTSRSSASDTLRLRHDSVTAGGSPASACHTGSRSHPPSTHIPTPDSCALTRSGDHSGTKTHRITHHTSARPGSLIIQRSPAFCFSSLLFVSVFVAHPLTIFPHAILLVGVLLTLNALPTQAQQQRQQPPLRLYFLDHETAAHETSPGFRSKVRAIAHHWRALRACNATPRDPAPNASWSTACGACGRCATAMRHVVIAAALQMPMLIRGCTLRLRCDRDSARTSIEPCRPAGFHIVAHAPAAPLPCCHDCCSTLCVHR